MSSLTNQTLLELVETQRQWFTEDDVPLSDSQLNDLEKCKDVVATDLNSLKRNTVKRRAHKFLNEVWATFPEVFILCALSANPTRLGFLKSSDYIPVLDTWWKNVHHPRGLVTAISRYRRVLPRRSLPPSYCAKVRRDDLLSFLQDHFGTNEFFTIRVPQDAYEHPTIELSSELCQELILHALERTASDRLLVNPS